MSTETVSQQQIPAGTWTVDPVHSSVGFAVTHNGITTFRSGFERYEARLTGGEQPRLEGTVEVESIAIDEEMLKGHLLSPEFFDTQRFPQLRFGSTELTVGEDGTARVVGELEIRGEARKVEAGGRFAHIGGDLAGKERVGLSISATVDRRDFGLDWQAQLPSGGDVLEYAVTIDVELELVAEEA
ncbi:MAG TPA: YceI family protein [Solirubrobacterales bacterium]|jgi:polyisoprenoid-binding protein YceI|nr:YceI family protein [Solirubrobacterales bacterium]